MKQPIMILISIILLLVVFIFLGLTELKKESDLKQSQIDHLKKTNEEQRDSLEKILKLKDDSLKIAFETIRTASAEREEAHRRTQKTISDLRKIIFIQHSDSSRNVELSKLYPSYNP